jgi:hypothetical protein
MNVKLSIYWSSDVCGDQGKAERWLYHLESTEGMSNSMGVQTNLLYIPHAANESRGCDI